MIRATSFASISHDSFQSWINKPWHKKPSRSGIPKQVRQCRITDEHTQSAYHRLQRDDPTAAQGGSERSRSPHRKPEPDETSLLARQIGTPRDHQSSDPSPPFDDFSLSSPSASTFDSEEASDFFHIFRLRTAMTSARIRTDSWPLTISNIRHVLELGRHEIQNVHLVTFLPLDLQASGTQVALVQQDGDLQNGDLRRLVLIDVVYHEQDAASTNTHRYPEILQHYMTRRVLLEVVGVHPYCRATRQQCIVHHNGNVIALSNYAPFELSHGDYIRIDLPPFRQPDLPTRAVAVCLRDGVRVRDLRQHIDQV